MTTLSAAREPRYHAIVTTDVAGKQTSTRHGMRGHGIGEPVNGIRVVVNAEWRCDAL